MERAAALASSVNGHGSQQAQLWRDQLWSCLSFKRVQPRHNPIPDIRKSSGGHQHHNRQCSCIGGHHLHSMLDWLERYHIRIKLVWLLVSVVGYLLFAIGSYYVADLYKFSMLWYSDILTGSLYTLMYTLESARACAGTHKKSTYNPSFQGMVDLINALMLLLPFIALGVSPTGSKNSIVKFNAAFNFVRASRLQRPYWAVYKVYHSLPEPMATRARHARFFKFAALGGVGGMIVLLFSSYLLAFNELLPDAVGLHGIEDATFQFHDSVYFTVETMSTVGYGDITPTGPLGQVLIIIVICIGIGVFSTVVSDVISYVAFQPHYGGSVPQPSNTLVGGKTDKKHTVICGHLHAPRLRRFLKELYHPDHGAPRIEMTAVMGPNEPSNDVKQLLVERPFHKSLQYFQGDTYDDAELKRLRLTQAAALFILTDLRHSKPADAAFYDAKSLLQAVAAKKLCPTLPVYLQLALPRYRHLAAESLHASDQLVCAEDFKANMLASNAISPGVIPMVHNLLSSCPSNWHNQGGVDATAVEYKWRREYTTGATRKLLRCTVPQQLVGLSMREAAMACFRYSEACLIALGTRGMDGTEDILKIPAVGYTISTNDVGYFIATSLSSVEGMTDRLSQTLISEELLKPVIHTVATPGPSAIDAEAGDHLSMHDWDSTDCPATDHVLLCGIPVALREFLQTLRSLRRREAVLLLPVILLCSNITEDAASELRDFPNCLFLQGSAMRIADLERARAGYASTIIVMGTYMQTEHILSERAVDGDAVLTYMEVQAYLRERFPDFKGLVTIDLHHPPNIKFLTSAAAYDKDIAAVPFTLNAVFAAGMVYSNYTADTLLCQTFYNPKLNTILRMLLGLDHGLLACKKREHDAGSMFASRIRQVKLPQEVFDRIAGGDLVMYGELFDCLVRRCLMPLGLYRQAIGVQWGTDQRK
eukprot:jgi/Chlat1/335/Chrsp1S03195